MKLQCSLFTFTHHCTRLPPNPYISTISGPFLTIIPLQVLAIYQVCVGVSAPVCTCFQINSGRFHSSAASVLLDQYIDIERSNRRVKLCNIISQTVSILCLFTPCSKLKSFLCAVNRASRTKYLRLAPVCTKMSGVRNPTAYFGVYFVVVLLCSDPPSNQVITDGVGKGEVIIPFHCHVPVLHHREVQMPVKICFEVHHIFHPCESSDRNLFFPVVV